MLNFFKKLFKIRENRTNDFEILILEKDNVKVNDILVNKHFKCLVMYKEQNCILVKYIEGSAEENDEIKNNKIIAISVKEAYFSLFRDYAKAARIMEGE
jgi:hypothetical protein